MSQVSPAFRALESVKLPFNSKSIKHPEKLREHLNQLFIKSSMTSQGNISLTLIGL